MKRAHSGLPRTPAPRAWRSVLALWLVLLALGAAVIVRTPFVADLSAFLPASPDAQQRVLIEQLQSGVAARTLFIGIDGGTAQQRALASRALAGALRASPLFEQVQNGDTDGYAGVGRWLFEHRYQLSPAVEPARFTAAGLREALAESLSLLGTPAGNALKPLLNRDPSGEMQRMAESMLPASGPRSEDGIWVAREGARALLLAGTRAAGADLDGQARAIDALRQAFANAVRATQAGDARLQMQAQLQLRLSGAPLFAVESRAQIEHEVRWLALAGTLLMSLLLLLAFASLPALLVAMLPVATGVLAGIAAVSLVFGNVHGITLGFGTTLIGEAVDYAIYYLVQARGQHGWSQWLRQSWPTVRLGLLTSVCGFAALAFSGFPGLAQLGVFSMAGLFGAALATRYVLPVLMPDGARGVGLRVQLGALAARLVRVLPMWRRPLLALGTASALWLVWLVAQGGGLWRAELSALSPISKAALALDASLRRELSAGDGGTLLVVQGPDVQTTLQRAEAVAARLEPLVANGVLAGYSSVTRWLPSLATQSQRLASLPEPAQLRAALAEATVGGPLKPERLAPFLADVENARGQTPASAITWQSLRGTALAPLVDALLAQRPDGSWAALMPLQAGRAATDSTPTPAFASALQQALQGAPGVQAIDIGPELSRLYRHYLGEAQSQALLGALGVVLLMALWLRDWRRLLAVCQPLLLAVLLTLGGLAVFDVQLGILHLVGLLLVVAVGSNYALFFDLLQGAQNIDVSPEAAQGTAPNSSHDSAHDTLASLLLANLTTVLSFGLIALSSIPALSAIGRVVAPGALLALLLAAAFAKAPQLGAATPRPAP